MRSFGCPSPCLIFGARWFEALAARIAALELELELELDQPSLTDAWVGSSHHGDVV